ncbi:MAG: TatD family hydrolase [Candidatus Sungbacteria bacterium]|nr:TatD family hydrolase [Candidatus Sungbacteria bacterium]
MTPQLFDVHTHTQFAAYAEDKDAVIRRALDVGVWIVNVGTQRDTSEAAVETAHRYAEGIYAAVGLHPVHTEKSYHDKQELGITNQESGTGFTSRGEEFDFEYYKKLAQDPKVVAIGECGLDYYRLGEETKERQKEAFLKQIALAHEVRKPLMIHCRNAFADLVAVLQATSYQLQASAGVIHFFAGTVDDARALLNLGFSFSFGGVITFARDYDEVVRYIPIERIVLETDAPYITPVPYRGRRNEPAYITEVAKKLAEIKALPYETAAEITTKNAMRCLGLTQAPPTSNTKDPLA